MSCHHRYNVIERVKYGRPATFAAQCTTCGWASPKRATEDDAVNDGDGHIVAMGSVA